MSKLFSRTKDSCRWSAWRLWLTVLGVSLGTADSARAEVVRHSTPGDLFYNYYVPPVGPSSVGAELYPCPRPTPPLVGHTYITYQPLMPHEFLYKHHRHYTTSTKTPRRRGRRCIGGRPRQRSISRDD